MGGRANFLTGGGGRGLPMSDRKRMGRGKSDWRDYANSAEKADLLGLEENARVCDERRRLLTSQISLIRERCLQRRRLQHMRACAHD